MGKIPTIQKKKKNSGLPFLIILNKVISLQDHILALVRKTNFPPNLAEASSVTILKSQLGFGRRLEAILLFRGNVTIKNHLTAFPISMFDILKHTCFFPENRLLCKDSPGTVRYPEETEPFAFCSILPEVKHSLLACYLFPPNLKP